MPVQLSPDGRYYWDGARWVSAVSADGAWRWDGTAWRPAGRPVRVRSQTAVLIAAGVVIALLVGGLGLFGFVRLVANAQRSLQSQFAPSCSANGTAGHDLAVGDTVCGYRLGEAQITAACDAGAVPDGLRGWRRVGTTADPEPADITVDESGCDLDVVNGSVLWLETAKVERADVVVVADYVPATDWGLLGIELACNRATCVKLGIDPAGVYRIDEQRAVGTWRNVARGALPVAAISRLGEPNRLVLRYSGRALQVFLDGYSVVRVTTGLLHASGVITFYMDDRIGTEPAEVHLRTLDVFASI